MPLLDCANLHKTYTLGKVAIPVLKGVTLAVEEGEIVAILGQSGSGKSTLLHLLGGLDRPDASPMPRIDFRGESVTGMSNRRLNQYRSKDVGFVFQFYHLLPELSVLENVAIAAMVRHGVSYAANSGEHLSRAADLLQSVGLGHRLKHRPAELSGGERQRVAIARALINQPTLLLADEPTGNLDAATGATILDMLMDLRAKLNQTMVIVTHDPKTAQRATRVISIKDGTIAPT